MRRSNKKNAKESMEFAHTVKNILLLRFRSGEVTDPVKLDQDRSI